MRGRIAKGLIVGTSLSLLCLWAAESLAQTQTPPSPSRSVTVIGKRSDMVGDSPTNSRAIRKDRGGNYTLSPYTASSCAFMSERDERVPFSRIPLRENAPFGDASQPIDAGRIYDNQFDSFGNRVMSHCSMSDRAFAAGRLHIARKDHSLVDAYAAFDAGDYPKALELFEASYRKMGYNQAAYMLGQMYLTGTGTAVDVPEALKWLKTSTEYQGPPAKEIYRFDPERPYVMPGTTDAMMTIGRIYLYGYQVPQDFRQARQWIAKAEAYGYVPAGQELGIIHLSGFGVKADAKKAAIYFKGAAELGFSPSQYSLGLLYYTGAESLPRDVKQAAAWVYHATRRGYPDALYTMGQLYERGEGVEADRQKALIYYKEAAIKGQPDAQTRLGIAFYKGDGTPQDMLLARKLFQVAATQGQADAMFNLAAMSYRGEGGDKDYAQAFVWFTRAGQAGHPDADAALKAVETVITPEDRAKAEAILNPPPQN